MGEIAILAGFALLVVTWSEGTSRDHPGAGPARPGRKPRQYPLPGSGHDPLDNITGYLFGRQTGGAPRGNDPAPGKDPLEKINDYLLGTQAGDRSRGGGPRREGTPPGARGADSAYEDNDDATGRDPLEDISDYLLGTQAGDRSRGGSPRREEPPPDEGEPDDDYDDEDAYDNDGYDEDGERDPLEDINDYLFGKGRSRRGG